MQVADSSEDPLNLIRGSIPPGADVMNGLSTTLIEIGFDYLLKSGQHPWKNLHDAITSENDERMRKTLRRLSITADYLLSSANAIATTGKIVACDKTGSRTGAWPFECREIRD